MDDYLGYEKLYESKAIQNYNVGSSDYSKHKYQPWDGWEEYKLDPWDADILKRILRRKSSDNPKLDYEKIIHICKKKIELIDKGWELYPNYYGCDITNYKKDADE